MLASDRVTVGCIFYTTPLPSIPIFARNVYTSMWVDKLYRMVKRNYSKPFDFVCLTDREYPFEEPITQRQLRMDTTWDRLALQIHAIEAPGRLVHFGLDTVITGSLDELFQWDGQLATHRDPYHPSDPGNGMVLGTYRPDLASMTDVTDMTVYTKVDHEWLDDLFPGQVLSYKVHVRSAGGVPPNARVIYFHGYPKIHQLPINDPLVRIWYVDYSLPW